MNNPYQQYPQDFSSIPQNQPIPPNQNQAVPMHQGISKYPPISSNQSVQPSYATPLYQQMPFNPSMPPNSGYPNQDLKVRRYEKFKKVAAVVGLISVIVFSISFLFSSPMKIISIANKSDGDIAELLLCVFIHISIVAMSINDIRCSFSAKYRIFAENPPVKVKAVASLQIILLLCGIGLIFIELLGLFMLDIAAALLSEYSGGVRFFDAVATLSAFFVLAYSVVIIVTQCKLILSSRNKNLPQYPYQGYNNFR